jgi:hypothetical protein
LTTKLLTDEALVDAKTADDKAPGLATAANIANDKAVDALADWRPEKLTANLYLTWLQYLR